MCHNSNTQDVRNQEVTQRKQPCRSAGAMLPIVHSSHRRRPFNLCCQNTQWQQQETYSKDIAKSLGGATRLRTNWTTESEWINQSTTRTLHNCLKEHTKEYQIIFVVNATRCHIHRDIMNHTCRHGMWMLYVPMKMTWLLQPLDAYVFVGFRSHLKQQYADPKYLTDTDNMPSITWLRRLWHSIKHKVQCLNWKSAYSTVGLLDQQQNITEHVAAFTKNRHTSLLDAPCQDLSNFSTCWKEKLVCHNFNLLDQYCYDKPGLLQICGQLLSLFIIIFVHQSTLQGQQLNLEAAVWQQL